jgi:riboflavin synthase
MFTGIVDDVGTIDRVASTDAGRELGVRCRYDDLSDGESIALNGVCLTVRDRRPGFFTCAAIGQTRDLTTIGGWDVGRRVNLERALRPTDRLGGHIVQGHVDAVARVTRAEGEGDSLLIDLAVPAPLSELMVERGSIAVDGVSLTIHALPASDIVRVFIIEYTRAHTTLGSLRSGDCVNVEADVIAKYVRMLMQRREAGGGRPQE